MPVDHTYLISWAMHVLFAHVHNCPSMTGNGRQQTGHCAYIAVVLYSRPKLLNRLVSDTRSVQMPHEGYVLCRTLVQCCNIEKLRESGDKATALLYSGKFLQIVDL